VEYAPAPRTLPAVQFGIQPPAHADAVERAVAAAANADAVVVMVGTTAEWETEGHDRTSLRLPGAQDELVAAVAAANPRTVVVVVAGGPVEMPWCEEVDAVLWSYFGGLEMAEAIADVLTGAADPGGRLPTTFPLRLADHPAAFSYPGDAGTMYYGEDVFVGYRGYDRREAPVRFPFGHGLSYAPVSWGEARIEAGSGGGSGHLTAVVPLHNPHDGHATEVVQAYVAGPAVSAWQRPPRQLAGFTKVHLAPGERRDVPVELVPRAFEVWDAHAGDWAVERGTYTVHVGRSSRDLRAAIPVAVP
jgi:beta-glucosidase